MHRVDALLFVLFCKLSPVSFRRRAIACTHVLSIINYNRNYNS